MMQDQIKDAGPSIEEYVIQQARERAFQISVEGIKNYQSQLQRIFNEKRIAVDQDIQAQKTKVLAEHRIQRSASINSSRLKKMSTRQSLIESLYQQVFDRLVTRLKDKGVYEQFLRKSILEGLSKLNEEHVSIRCLSKDKDVLQALIPTISAQYLVLNQHSPTPPQDFKLELDERHFLSPKSAHHGIFLEKGEESELASGGVVLSGMRGLIVLKNTVETRLQMVTQESLPEMREKLFGETR